MLPYTPATCSPCSPRQKFLRVNDSVDYFRVTNYYGLQCTNKVNRIAVHAGRVVHVFGFVVQSSSICLRVACYLFPVSLFTVYFSVYSLTLAGM